jgi:hypothetical protein
VLDRSRDGVDAAPELHVVAVDLAAGERAELRPIAKLAMRDAGTRSHCDGDALWLVATDARHAARVVHVALDTGAHRVLGADLPPKRLAVVRDLRRAGDASAIHFLDGDVYIVDANVATRPLLSGLAVRSFAISPSGAIAAFVDRAERAGELDAIVIREGEQIRFAVDSSARDLAWIAG